MTDETRKHLPDIIKRIYEIRGEVRKIHEEEDEEHQKRYDEMDRAAQHDAAHKDAQLFGAYITLTDAAMYLAKYQEDSDATAKFQER